MDTFISPGPRSETALSYKFMMNGELPPPTLFRHPLLGGIFVYTSKPVLTSLLVIWR